MKRPVDHKRAVHAKELRPRALRLASKLVYNEGAKASCFLQGAQAWCSTIFPEVNAETEPVSRLSKPGNYLQKNKKREKNAGAGVYTDSWKW